MRLMTSVSLSSNIEIEKTAVSISYNDTRYKSVVPKSGMLVVNEVRVNGGLVPFTLIGESIFIEAEPSQNILISGKEKG